MAIDLRKEIKLSELFRRRPKEPAEKSEEPKEKPPKPRRSFRSGRQEKAVVTPKEAPVLPAVPLMRAFNLLPSDEMEAAGGRVGLVPVLLAIAGLVVVAALAGLYLFASAGATDRRSDSDELRTQLAALQAVASSPGADAQPALQGEKAGRTAALAGALGPRLAWDRLLREFSLVLPDEVSLVSLQASSPLQPGVSAPATAPTATGPVANTFVITGFTKEQRDVALLLSRLSVLPEFSSVSLVSASETSLRDGTIQFSIAASIRQEGAGA
jgi:Tfp pilus assembly protein PilN